MELAPHKLHRAFTLTEASQLASKHGAKTLADLKDLRPLLSEDDIGEVADPIGQGPEVFVMVGARIAELLPPILELCRDTGDGTATKWSIPKHSR